MIARPCIWLVMLAGLVVGTVWMQETPATAGQLTGAEPASHAFEATAYQVKDIIITSSILLGAIVLLSTDWIRADVVAILVLTLLAFTGQVSTQEALAGFSNTAVISIIALLILSLGMVRSGAVHWLAIRLRRIAGTSNRRVLLVSVLPPAVLSGVVNIVAAVSIFIPAVLHLARENGIPRSKLLIPLAFTSLAGANLTLIGAGHNLIVHSIMRQSGEQGLRFFELTPLGLILVAALTLYSLLFAGWLLPSNRNDPGQSEQKQRDNLITTYQLAERLWEIWVRRDTPIVGTSLKEISIGRRYGLSVISLLRDGRQQAVDEVEIRLNSEDVLLVGGRREKAEQLCQENEGLLLAGPPQPQTPFPSSEAELIEIVVPPRSAAIGKTLRQMHFRDRTGLIGVALWRQGQPQRTDARDTPLEPGDGVLLFGSRTRTRNFQPSPDFLWLTSPGGDASPQEFGRQTLSAAGILAVVITVAAAGWASIAIVALAGAVAMILLKILTPQQAYAAVDWRTIALIGGMYPLGTALQNSGAVDLVARLLTQIATPHASLWAIGLLAILLTQPMHSAVVAVILTPMALGVAQNLGVSPLPFALAVTVGASASYLLPVGHPAPLLVQEPGEYQTSDYLRFGLGPVLIVWAVIGWIIPMIWPLHAVS
ncbi:MAG: SLC13 family permease [Pirellulaceae bacterium]